MFAEVVKRNEKGKKMVLVKLKDRERKMEVMRKKWGLKGRGERIEDDLMVKERKIQWRLKRMAEEERRNKRAAWVKYTRIWMGARW